MQTTTNAQRYAIQVTRGAGSAFGPATTLKNGAVRIFASREAAEAEAERINKSIRSHNVSYCAVAL